MTKLLIAIPVKDFPGDYLQRIHALQDTWVQDAAGKADVKFFTDFALGVTSSSELARQLRMKAICQYALDHGYDFLFRVDSDAYVWIDRLLESGFQYHDYMGHCYDYPARQARHRTGNGGPGFTLSRKAMQVIANHPTFFPVGNPPIYFGDIWTGMVLFDNGIRIHRSERFYDGAGKEDLLPSDFPPDHNFITVHPVRPEDLHKFASN